MSIYRFAKIVCACAVIVCVAAPRPGRADDESSSGLDALVELLGSNDDPQFQLDVLKGMNDGLKGRREVKMPAGWEAVAAKLSRSTSAPVRELAQSLSVTFGSASALAALRATLLNSSAAPAARSNALVSLLAAKDKNLPAVLQLLLKDALMRGGTLRGLAAYDDAKTPSAILDVYPSLTSVEKKDALNTLASRAAFARPLLAAVGEKIIPAKELTADIVRSLRNFKDPQINEQVAKLWGTVRETEGDKLKEIARFKKLTEILNLP